MKIGSTLLLFLAGLQASVIPASASSHASIIKEYDRAFTTYPYSDPDPVPAMTKFYPYFRYDGFTDTPVQKNWRVVELSNDYVQLLILPEIGGKVWTAIDKTTGKPFIYFNHVVKFRDVSMRGPWTSGGIEANYGIMGHTPNCFSPVDYLTRRNPDGSASCFIGVLDLLTRTTWRLEINLPAGQACFTTRSLWQNTSPNEQPYYTWMNVGIKAAGNLHFVNPGTHYVGHDGLAAAWPLDPANGHDLSWHDQNDFGSYKSYHILGRLSEFFGGYWKDEDFGMAHYATYADKPGRKIWIWGLSREGTLWEKLLTDTDGQYVEVQSGRLFNQGAPASSRTPFKQVGFPSHATDTWTEYWLPIKGTKGFVSASPYGAMNVTREGTRLFIRICPVRPMRDQLEVFDGQRLLYSKSLQLRPMQPVEEVVELPSATVPLLKVSLGGDKLHYAASEESLCRPMEAQAHFDPTSVYGLYLKGRDSARQQEYAEATEAFRSCLKREPDFAPALVELAALANRRADWSAACDFAFQALRVDTYDPIANYQLGLGSVGMGWTSDAQAAFSIAALSPAWRSAASLELAKVFFRQQRYERAADSLQNALENNARNLDAWQLRACLCRLQGDTRGAQAALKTLLGLDPLNHFARFEECLAHRSRTGVTTVLQAKAVREFTRLIRNELPQETYLELTIWYHNMGLDADAAKVLELAPPTAEVLYWLAYLAQDTNRLAQAETASPSFVFPSRPESIPVFQWAADASPRPSWQPKYYLALLRWHLGELARARALLTACGETPRFGPFYAIRAQLNEATAAADLQKAAQLDPDQWRYGVMLARHHFKQGDLTAAMAVATDYAERFATNNVLAVLHAKSLVANARYQAAAQLLDSLNLLPCEGSTEARSLYREAHLMLAVAAIKSGALAEARRQVELAREWPDHLGSGRPYPTEVDERLEDWLTYQCSRRECNSSLARSSLDHLLGWLPHSRSNDLGTVIRALALKESGQLEQSHRLLNNWLKQDPADKLAEWGLELLGGRPAAFPSKAQDVTSRVLSAWWEVEVERRARAVLDTVVGEWGTVEHFGRRLVGLFAVHAQHEARQATKGDQRSRG